MGKLRKSSMKEKMVVKYRGVDGGGRTNKEQRSSKVGGPELGNC